MRQCFLFVSDLTPGMYNCYLPSSQEIFVNAVQHIRRDSHPLAHIKDMERKAVWSVINSDLVSNPLMALLMCTGMHEPVKGRLKLCVFICTSYLNIQSYDSCPPSVFRVWIFVPSAALTSHPVETGSLDTLSCTIAGVQGFILSPLCSFSLFGMFSGGN